MQQTIKNEPKVELDYLHNRMNYITKAPILHSQMWKASEFNLLMI